MPLRRSVLAVLAIALPLAACAPVGEVPTDSFHRLSVAPPASAAGQAAFPGVVEVRAVDADGILAERALAFSDGGEGGEGGVLRQYSYHFWVESPAQAVQRELADYLRASGRVGQVVTPRFRVRPDVEVQGRLGRLEQVMTPGGGAKAVVELELGAERTGRDGALVLLRTYRAEAPAADASPAAAAAAVRAALGDIFGRFTDDLIQALTTDGRT